LIALSRGETFPVSTPSLAIVRLRVEHLLDPGLKRVSDVRTEVKGVVESDLVLLIRG
jgi:hypothetical protein